MTDMAISTPSTSKRQPPQPAQPPPSLPPPGFCCSRSCRSYLRFQYSARRFLASRASIAPPSVRQCSQLLREEGQQRFAHDKILREALRLERRSNSGSTSWGTRYASKLPASRRVKVEVTALRRRDWNGEWERERFGDA